MKINVKCSFCDNLADSRDHIPSKNLLEKPFPNNLLTIPCCKKCNHSFSLDEEYFLNVLVEISSNPNLIAKKEIGGNVYIARKRSPKLKSKLMNHIFKIMMGNFILKLNKIELRKLLKRMHLGYIITNIKKELV